MGRSGHKVGSLANLNTVWAFIYVEQPMLSQIAIGMTVEGFLPEMMEKSLKGKLLKLVMKPNLLQKMCKQEKSDQGLFCIKIQFENQEKILKPECP